MMHRDGRIDQIAPKGPEPRERAILVRASKQRVADDVGHQDRGEFACLGHGAIAEAGRSPVAVAWAWLHFHAALVETRRAGNADPAVRELP